MSSQAENALVALRKSLFVYPTAASFPLEWDQAIPLAANLHQDFGHDLKTDHNCLGCAFSELTWAIDHCLFEIASGERATFYSYYNYLIWLYLFVERADSVMDVVSLPVSYRARRFGVFVPIRRWANFVKHPGYFLFVHHPHFTYVGDPEFDESEYDQIIDSKFVVENFGAEAKQRRSTVRVALQNKKRIAVQFPGLEAFTEEFCEAAGDFFALIRGNDVYREILSEVSTFREYFSE